MSQCDLNFRQLEKPPVRILPFGPIARLSRLFPLDKDRRQLLLETLKCSRPQYMIDANS